MNTTEEVNAQVNFAKELAAFFHRNHIDRTGLPYFFHVERVGNAGKTPEEKIVGYLHDTLEDTVDIKNQAVMLSFLEVCFGARVAFAVLRLTKYNDIPYEEYIQRILKDPLARAVKINDVKDNMTRPSEGIPLDKRQKMLEKYTRALKTLTSVEN